MGGGSFVLNLWLYSPIKESNSLVMSKNVFPVVNGVHLLTQFLIWINIVVEEEKIGKLSSCVTLYFKMKNNIKNDKLKSMYLSLGCFVEHL